MLFFIGEKAVKISESKNLNTSHVILYPIASVYGEIVPEFKYISCYSLSGRADQEIYLL